METSTSAQDPDGLPTRCTHTADTSPSVPADRDSSGTTGAMGHEAGMGWGGPLRIRRLPTVAGTDAVSVSIFAGPHTLSCLGILRIDSPGPDQPFYVVSAHTLMVEK